MIVKIDILPLFVGILMITSSPSRGQEISTRPAAGNAWGIQLHNTISYSGFSNALSLSFSGQSFQVYGGARLLTSRVYLPRRGPWGLQAGLRYLFLTSDRLRATAGIDYQLGLSKPYNPRGLKTNRVNQVHEVNFSYGLMGRIWNELWIGSDIGFGGYSEVYQDLLLNTTRNYGGYSSLIRIYLHYEW